MLKDELDFFIANQIELVKKYKGKVLVIKDQQIIGIYSDILEAYLDAQKEHQLGTFLIQPCKPGPEAFTVTITSNNICWNS